MSGVRHAEHGDVQDRSCAVSQIEKLSPVVLKATKDGTKLKEPVSLQDGTLASRDRMSVDWSAAVATTHIHPDCSAKPISCGEYVDAVLTQLCDHEGRDATNEQATE